MILYLQTYSPGLSFPTHSSCEGLNHYLLEGSRATLLCKGNRLFIAALVLFLVVAP
jgi:hypothetical protein